MENIFYVADFDGNNDDERISACLEKASQFENSTVVFANRDFETSQAILLYSGMTVLIDNCVIRQKNETFDNVFRSVNVKLNSNNPYASTSPVKPLKDVRILGKGNAVIEGPTILKKSDSNDIRNRKGYSNGLLENQDMVGCDWGFLAYQILCVGVDGLEIGGISFVKPKGFAVTIDLCTHIHVYDIDVNSTCKNGDGIHLLSGCSHAIIERITGTTTDDTVAVQSGNRLALLSPMEHFYDTMSKEELSSHHIIIRDVKAGGRYHNVILLPLNETSIYNVTIENITDTSRIEPYHATVFLYTGVYGGPGVLRDITVKNIDSLADTCFVSNVSIDNLTLSNLINRSEKGKLYGTYPVKP